MTYEYSYNFLEYLIANDFIRKIYSTNDNLCDYYYIDRNSNVYSLYSLRLLKTCIKENGYVAVSLNTKDNNRIQRKVHRLTMFTYCYFPGCELLEINHKNGNKLNNSIGNLEWMTGKENIRHAIDNGLRASWNGTNNPNCKLSEADVIEISKMVINGLSNEQIKQFYDISDSTINSIISGRLWNNLFSEEYINQMLSARHPNRLLVNEKHMICKYFESNPLHKVSFGDVRRYIIETLVFNNISPIESHITQAKRLYYRYQDPEITSLYKY